MVSNLIKSMYIINCLFYDISYSTGRSKVQHQATKLVLNRQPISALSQKLSITAACKVTRYSFSKFSSFDPIFVSLSVALSTGLYCRIDTSFKNTCFILRTVLWLSISSSVIISSGGLYFTTQQHYGFPSKRHI